MRHMFATYLNLAEFLSEDFKLEEGKDFNFKATSSNSYRLKIHTELEIIRLFFLKEEMQLVFVEKKIKTFSYKLKDIEKIKEIISQIIYGSNQVSFWVKATNDKIQTIIQGEG